ncbi:MAG: DNA repair protein RadA [Planctomycetes bacterium]|nr:DNA repair protein RadA [Planctomycetota bacterium]
MSKKKHARYVCSECGASFARWSGRCPNCGEWDSLAETVSEGDSSGFRRAGQGARPAESYTLPEIPEETRARLQTGITEFDRVLGGGILHGGTVLIGGEPGIGKSTVLLQALGKLAQSDHPCIYVSCEESLSQIKLRAERLGVSESPLQVAAETSLDSIAALLEQEKPEVTVVDSIQMVIVDDLDSPIGSLTHLKTSGSELIRQAKRLASGLFLVGHVTKSGSIAGPKALEHMVDTVLYFESEHSQSFRILRATKNRFGSVNEIGVFQMGETGLRDVTNPSELFLSERDAQESGSVVTAAIEGNRALLVEIQALVTPSSYGTPERKASGIDYKRFGMLLSVLDRRVGLNLGPSDAFANVAGGVRVAEPAADLPLALAIISSKRDVPFPADAVAIGEVGLSGEVRAVSHLDRRLTEAAKLGFEKAIVPAGNKKVPSGLDIGIKTVRHLREGLGMLEE